jgi:hypothetical protein
MIEPRIAPVLRPHFCANNIHSRRSCAEFAAGGAGMLGTKFASTNVAGKPRLYDFLMERFFVFTAS